MSAYRNAVCVYFLMPMLSVINDLAVKWEDTSDVPVDFRDLCRPFALVISVLGT